MPPTNRGAHPDLTPDGDLRPDVFADPAEREFARLHQDEARYATFMDGVTARQSLEPTYVQQFVGGRTYAAGASPLQGYREYMDDVAYARMNVAASEGKTVFLDDADIRRMSNEQFDAHFDERGAAREHVYYHSNASVPLDGTMDPWTARELQRSRKEQP